MKHLLFALILLFAAGCSSEETADNQVVKRDEVDGIGKLLRKRSPNETNIHFANNLSEDDSNNIFRYEYFNNGGGVSIGDINNDGLADIYFTGNMVKNALYLNKGNLEFEDITTSAFGDSQNGWCFGSTMADVNGDGHLDIYVCRAGHTTDPDLLANLLYINNGDQTFTESASEYGLADILHSTQAAFFDYDLDGDLDMFLVNVPPALKHMDVAERAALFKYNRNHSDHLYRNDHGKFVDVSKEAGINNHAFGLGLSVSDYDGDGYQDVYVSNDYDKGDFMFMNRKGMFMNEVSSRTKHTSNFGMGTDAADYNNDGHVDFIELDMAYPSHVRSKRNMESMSTEKFWRLVKSGNHFQYMVNTLQLANGNGTFSEIGQLAGVSKTDWSWSALFADLDNDGWKDLIITNGQQRDLTDRDFRAELSNQIISKNKTNITTFMDEEGFEQVFSLASASVQSNYAFRNKGDLTFDNATIDWGFDEKINSYGMAYGDLDNDGDLDLVVSNIDQVASVYENTVNGDANYLDVELRGNGLNTFAIGAKVKIHTANGIQLQEAMATRGYQSSVPMRLHFGLGQLEQAEKVSVTWPDGKTSEVIPEKINQCLLIAYDEVTFADPNDTQTPTIFDRRADAYGIDFIHRENQYNDFEREVLLPHALSRQGPCLAVGDVNSDGLEDVFVGGAKEIPGALYVQKKDAVFVHTKQPAFSGEAGSEDVGALFFDADGDQDLDLYVCSGGNDYDENDAALQDRLYLNGGRGDFSLASDALPIMLTSTKVVVAHDFEGDGDEDLFVGGRVIPGKYPVAPRSYLLRNDGGTFTDITTQIAPDMASPGLVTGAAFEDVNGDGKVDVTLIGEWMPLTTYLQGDGKFEKEAPLPETEGLWFSLEAADIDQDGDMDFIAGNLGKNAKFKTSVAKPFNAYCNDFDKNGTLDIVLSTYEGETNYPVRGRECSSEQMPFISDRFPTFKQFAEADMIDLFGDELNKGLKLTARALHSCIFVNDGQGKFSMQHLPVEAQFSPIHGIIVEDINDDGNLDLITAGNMYGAEVETVRYDAGRGCCMLGDGKGRFTALKPEESGWFTWSNVKALKKLKVGDKHVYVVGINSGPITAFYR
ncbi:MAG: VCBS repeat-containing protein [Fuerstiella sp.]|nr:VCBS repeat-containing protein [Fuerstiella sp.]